MLTQQERRDSERMPCKLIVPFEMTQPAGADAVKLLEGYGHAINRSDRGVLLLLREEVNPRQVVEIHVPSEARNESTTKLMEVCWTRPITVNTHIKLYLAGTRALFELPVSSQSPQTR